MKIKYKTIIINAVGAIKEAEKLKTKGWIIGSVGFCTIEMYKKN